MHHAPNVAANNGFKVVLLTGLKWRLDQAGLFDKPTESSMIATWPGRAWHVLRSIGTHFSLT